MISSRNQASGLVVEIDRAMIDPAAAAPLRRSVRIDGDQGARCIC